MWAAAATRARTGALRQRAPLLPHHRAAARRQFSGEAPKPSAYPKKEGETPFRAGSRQAIEQLEKVHFSHLPHIFHKFLSFLSHSSHFPHLVAQTDRPGRGQVKVRPGRLRPARCAPAPKDLGLHPRDAPRVSLTPASRFDSPFAHFLLIFCSPCAHLVRTFCSRCSARDRSAGFPMFICGKPPSQSAVACDIWVDP